MSFKKLVITLLIIPVYISGVLHTKYIIYYYYTVIIKSGCEG